MDEQSENWKAKNWNIFKTQNKKLNHWKAKRMSQDTLKAKYIEMRAETLKFESKHWNFKRSIERSFFLLQTLISWIFCFKHSFLEWNIFLSTETLKNSWKKHNLSWTGKKACKCRNIENKTNEVFMAHEKIMPSKIAVHLIFTRKTIRCAIEQRPRSINSMQLNNFTSSAKSRSFENATCHGTGNFTIRSALASVSKSNTLDS